MSIFEDLNKINVNDHTEGKNGLTYLSWTWAWAEFKKACPEARYEVKKFNGLPYVYDENTGYMVYTSITVGDLTHEMWLPVMDSSNRAMKAHDYKYIAKQYGKEVEKTCYAATMFDINKTIMRCLTKNMAMFGLGLYIYAGEDLPEEEKKPEEPKKISAKDVEILTKLLTDSNVNIPKLCSNYKVASLEELDEPRYASIMKMLKERNGA